MSSHQVLTRVSVRLADLLWEAYQGGHESSSPMDLNRDAISLLNPTEARRDASNQVSFWLFQINENPHLKNQVIQRANHTDSPYRYPPLSLDLCFLLTPLLPSPENNLNLLGLSMKAFYDRSIFTIQEPGDEVHEELRIVLTNMELEELTRIWEALNEPYRLSVCYKVRVTRIDSNRDVDLGKVARSSREYVRHPVER